METKNQEFVEIDPMAPAQAAALSLMAALLGCAAVATLPVNLVAIRPTFESIFTRVYAVNQTEDKAVTTQDLQLGNFLVKDYKEIILFTPLCRKSSNLRTSGYGPWTNLNVWLR